MPRPDRAFRTAAIILKRRDFGEADRLLTVLTPAHGKLSVIAKGARKPATSRTGHVELFTRADMLIHRGRDFGILQQVEMTAPYLPLREDLVRGAYASYAAELLDRFTIEAEEDLRALFDLFDATLDRLCTAPDPLLAVRYFEMRLLDSVGFRPELTYCVASREVIEAEDQYFSYAWGGVVRPDHALRATACVPVAMRTLKLMRHLQRSSYETVAALQVPPDLHADIERIMLGYLTFVLERKLESVDFIARLRRLTPSG
jgi:DNA repair protein RecO (recombination protein O)